MATDQIGPLNFDVYSNTDHITNHPNRSTFYYNHSHHHSTPNRTHHQISAPTAPVSHANTFTTYTAYQISLCQPSLIASC